MFSLRHPVRVLALTLAAAVLSACDISGIGDGNKLETLEIHRQTGLLDTANTVSYLCFVDKLQVVGIFTNGGQADYSTRAVWSSSRPDVVAVSNGDLQLPENPGLAFAPGTIWPTAVGTATITASFVGLSAIYEVEVRDLQQPITISSASITLAPETSGSLKLSALVDGYTLDVTQGASWSFEAPDSTVAAINATTGLISARAPGAPLKAQAVFPLCADNPKAAGLSASVTVEPLQGLLLEREFLDAPNDELIVGTTETMKVTGTFSGGGTQDLTGQVRVVSDDVETVAPVSAALLPNLVIAIAAGTANLQAVYGGDDGNDAETDTDPPEVRSNFVALNAVARELDSIAITPLNKTITALGRQQFAAIGTYDVGAARQEITRSVSWSSSDRSQVEITSSLVSAGLAVSLRPQAGSVTITATRGAGDTAIITQTTLCMAEPGAQGDACPPPDDGSP